MIKFIDLRRPRRALIISHVVALLLLSCVAVIGAAAYPIVFTDDAGRDVVLATPPKRIISLAPSNTEILFAIGAGDQVVGVDDFSNFPDAVHAVAKVGTLRAPSYEVIVGLDPDLIVVSDLSGDHGERLLNLGYPVVHIAPESLAAIFDRIALLGQLVDREDQAADVISNMKARVADVEQRVADIPESEKPRVFYEVWNDPLMTAGPGSFMHELIEVAGGINIAADAQAAWPLFSLESVVERDPTVILTPFAETVSELLAGKRTLWQGIEAVEEGRIYWLDQDEISRPGPRIVVGLEAVARALYPDRFAHR